MEFTAQKKSLGALCVALSLSLVGCAAARIPAAVTPAAMATPTAAPVGATPTPIPSPTPGGGVGGGGSAGADAGATPTPIATPAPIATPVPTFTTPPFLPGTAVSNGGTSSGGGGGGGGFVVAVTALSVNGIAPASGATTAPINRMLTATFTRAMQAASLTTSTFTLFNVTTGIPVPTTDYTVSYAGTTATLKPTAPLAAGNTYRATITTGVMDNTGVALGSDYSWTFTTGATDAAVPTATVLPASGATGVAPDAGVVATFNEDIDPATVTGATFKLDKVTAGPTYTPVTGTVTHIGATAAFNPAVNLDLNTQYRVQLLTGIKDLAGNLLVPQTWTFTTLTAFVGAAPVVLGATLRQFAVFGQTTVTNTGATTVTGDLGLSPGSAVTGFPPGVMAGGGVQHVTNATAGTAAGEMGTAYTDAAGRVGGTLIVAGSDLGRPAVYTPGVYTSSNLHLTSQDMTFDAGGNANAIFIIQNTGTFTVAAGRKVLLIGSAKASNIFWQISTITTFGSGAEMQGNFLGGTDIRFLTGATLVGRALSKTQVTMQGNTITKPAP